MIARLSIICLLVATSQALSIKSKSLKNTPEVGFCSDSTDAWLTGIQLNISPWPAVVAAGEEITLEGQLELLQTVDPGSKIKLDLKLVTILGDVPIPCIPIGDLSIGSCEYPAERLLADLEQTGKCADLMPAGQPCALPLNPGVYAGNPEPLVITIPDSIPDALAPFLKGKIKAKVLGISPEGNENVCLEVLLELA